MFNVFISEAGLHDFNMGERRFTRFNKDGSKMSKLDRFLVLTNLFEIWKDASVSALERTLSDHCPIKLSVGLVNFGPKVFKFYYHWMGLPDFDELVKKSWTEGDYNGTPDIILKKKLKKLKNEVRFWSHKKMAVSKRSKDMLTARLIDWDSKVEKGELSRRMLLTGKG